MEVENPFLVFPREIRDMIYKYTLQDIKFTNILAHKTAYTVEDAPILYINAAIANDIKHLLYRDHEMLVHIVKTHTYAEGREGFLSHVKECSNLMKQRSYRFVAELWSSKWSRLDASYTGYEDIDEIFGNRTTVPRSWATGKILESDGGLRFSKKFFRELGALQRELPDIKKFEVNGWFLVWLNIGGHWKKPYKRCIKKGMDIDIKMAE
ncbi:hypothetical protein FGSG_00199 [Fusarium graminearum PH-1]|uniref:Chromosome 1, complete genome n=1 Tax=Gibberella zeae (strain ATCC MYA-4620 / CBS 123657 / FGSC 9075 / NRRL 31084 / PH-1) TaxID=229533 RepID=I1R9P6_GIBZE|nr:hypothetical protein FGSG_00199 [Fusarium graminearum PH-1]ESU05332.1 hypothetical protein FGSG_00199 [Fusarium graminearum PH-1]CEF72069.1 unnamed protein product [Fusarium graminearum]|eukprot:XP_011315817.1 hypothetical protein FGSG_00199 [Fusarium graminearum PH-1]